TLLQPTLRTHCERIKASVKKRHSRNKVFVYRRFNQEVDETAYNLIMTGEEKRFGVIDCNQKPSVRHLQELFDSTETNVIIMPVFDTEYAGGLIDQLRSEFPDYRFEVFGMPTWGNRAFIKRNEELINIAFSYTTPFYFDKTTASGKMLSDRYSETFGGTPNEWVFRGYETFLWYAGLLEKFGVVFNSRVNDFNTAIFTEYNIKPARDGSKNFLYNENQHLYLYRYQAGSYVVEH